MIASVSLGIDKNTSIVSCPSAGFDMLQLSDARFIGPCFSLLLYDLDSIDRLLETVTRVRAARANLIAAGVGKVANGA